MPREVYLVYVDGRVDHVCLSKDVAESVIRYYRDCGEHAFLRTMEVTTK